jgi:hypothetical protein
MTNGYMRLDQLNRFVPRDIKRTLNYNIGKDEMVIISDFLMGDDYRKVENPYLPRGLQDEIQSRPAIEKQTWIYRITKMLRDCTRSGPSDHHHVNDIAFVLRYISMYPLANDNRRFVEAVIRKCDKLLNEDIPEFIRNTPTISHHYLTRKNKKTRDVVDDRMRAALNLIQTADECRHIYSCVLMRL